MLCHGGVWAQISTSLKICGTTSQKNPTRWKTIPAMLQNFGMTFISFGGASHCHGSGGSWEAADNAGGPRGGNTHYCYLFSYLCCSNFTFIVYLVLLTPHEIKCICVSNLNAFASLCSPKRLQAKWTSQIMGYVNSFWGHPDITKRQSDSKFC